MPTNRIIYRHGDVTLIRVSEVPQTAAKIAEQVSFVVAEGETTGHKHVIVVSAPKTLLTVFKDIDMTNYYELATSATITHEEHKTLTIVPGIYKQVQEREKDWFSLTTRQVVD